MKKQVKTQQHTLNYNTSCKLIANQELGKNYTILIQMKTDLLHSRFVLDIR